MVFRQQLKLGLIKPESTKEGPLCMDTYRSVFNFVMFTEPLTLNPARSRWMFDCCRVPGPDGLDWSVSYAKQGDIGNTGHVVVFRKNRVWRVDAAKDGRILGTDDLQR